MVVTVAPMAAAILTPMWPRPADADDGDRAAGAGAPPAQRRVGRDAGAEQRRGDVEVHRVGDAQHEALADDDLLGVAAHRPLAVVALRVVGADRGLGAEHLHAVLARLALAARVDEAADADAVADGVPGDLVTDLDDGAGDLVADGQREVRRPPLLTHGVDVGVADAGEGDGDADVVGAQVAALDGALAEAGGRGVGDECGCRGRHPATLCRSELGAGARPRPRGRPWRPWSCGPSTGSSGRRPAPRRSAPSSGSAGMSTGQVVALADVLEHLARVQAATVVEGREDAEHAQLLVEDPLDVAHGVEQLADAAVAEHLARHRDDQRRGRR